MPNNDIPAMPDPDRPPAVANLPPHRQGNREKPDKPIRLEPALGKVKEPAPNGTEPPTPPPGPTSNGFPTKLAPKPLYDDEGEAENTVQPITSEDRWHNTGSESPAGITKRSKYIALSIATLAAVLVALAIWKNDHGSDDSPPLAPLKIKPAIEPEKYTWEAPAREVLRQYLDAESRGDIASQLALVSNSKETQALLPRFQPSPRQFDIISEDSFVAKPLFKEFTEKGIYLMYYQRPDSLTRDAIFRPIVPLRVHMSLDYPELLELAASNAQRKINKEQNIHAFFKRYPDGTLRLDWPVFVQTRYRLLDKFTSHPQAGKRQVFRLLAEKVPQVLVENIYQNQLTNHDWYHIHCPGYNKEQHVAAVDRSSEAGKLMSQRFEEAKKLGKTLQALTGELAWKESDKDQSPVLVISDIISWEFYNLSSGQ